MQRFVNKTVIVTGAGVGIGAATAWRFGAEGANLVLAGRQRSTLEHTASALDPARTLILPTDITDPEAVRALTAAAVARFGRLDVLVANAGVAAMSAFATTPETDWRQIMTTNIDGTIHCCQAAMPHLLAVGGSVIIVSSTCGLGGDRGFAFYNASKGALVNLTRALALEFGPKGVRVNAVNPGLTMTEKMEGMKEDPAMMALFADRIPLGRGAEPAEVAAVIAFLASPDASFVNGVNLPVDGGLTASSGQPNMC